MAHKTYRIRPVNLPQGCSSLALMEAKEIESFSTMLPASFATLEHAPPNG
jgi:hypothetical protein